MIFSNSESGISFLGKSFDWIANDRKNGIGIIRSLFSKDSLTVPVDDFKKLTKFWDALQNGSQDFTQAFDDIMSDAGEKAQDLAYGLADGSVAIEDIISAAGRGRVAMMGLKLETIALNTAVSVGLSLLIQFAAKGIDYLLHHQEQLHEEVQGIVEDYQDQNQKLRDSQATFDELVSKYGELSKGVNALGENVGLTAEKYEEYKNVSNRIGEMCPSLVQGFDSVGTAILKNKDNLAEFNEEYERMMDNADNTVLDNARDVWKDFQNSRENLENGGWSLDMGMNAYNALKNVLSSDDLDAAVAEYIDHAEDINIPAQIQNALYGEGFEFDPSKYKTPGEFLADAIRDDQMRVRRILEDYEEEMGSAISGIASTAMAYVDKSMRSSEFSGIDSTIKTLVDRIVSGFDYDFYSQFDSLDAMYEYLHDMLTEFSGLDSDSVGAIKLAFDMQTKFNNGECSVDEYAAAVGDAMNILSAFGEDEQGEEIQKQVKLLFGINGEESIEDWKDGLEQVANAAKAEVSESEKVGFTDIVDEDFQKQVDEYLERAKEYRQALEDFKSGNVSADELRIQIPELSQYGANTEFGLTDLIRRNNDQMEAEFENQERIVNSKGRPALDRYHESEMK